MSCQSVGILLAGDSFVCHLRDSITEPLEFRGMALGMRGKTGAKIADVAESLGTIPTKSYSTILLSVGANDVSDGDVTAQQV